jgi:protein-disulfide isomerase
MSKQFWAVVAVIVLVFIGIFTLTGHKSNSTSNKSANQPTQHVIGKGSTGVTLVEYGDYECPYCEQYYPVVKQVQQEYNDKIFFQFRNFPLVNVHVNAFAAARAAEAAGLQDKFWEMHDALYEPGNWQVWSTASDPTPYFNQLAQQLRLDATQFKSDFGSTKINNLVNADMAEGNKLKIQGTPTFFLDGKQVSIGISVADFEKAINAEIAKKAAASATTKQ